MCKTAQFCATRRESEMAETPSVRNCVQASENGRKNSFLNYKIAFTGFKTGDGVMGFVSPVGYEWVLLINLPFLLMGFALLSRHFEKSHLPVALPKFLPQDWKGASFSL
jgi:hypothetical protein